MLWRWQTFALVTRFTRQHIRGDEKRKGADSQQHSGWQLVSSESRRELSAAPSMLRVNVFPSFA